MDSVLLIYKAFSAFSYFSFNSLVIKSYFSQKDVQVNLIYCNFKKLTKYQNSHTYDSITDFILFKNNYGGKKNNNVYVPIMLQT